MSNTTYKLFNLTNLLYPQKIYFQLSYVTNFVFSFCVCIQIIPLCENKIEMYPFSSYTYSEMLTHCLFEVVTIEERDIFEQIAENYNGMSPIEQRISNHLLQHKTDIQIKTISELAKACDVSSASLTRYARTLGYPSFSAFRTKMYADSVQNIPDKVGMSEVFDLYSEVYAEDGIDLKCQKLCNICIESLQQTRKHINLDSVKHAVELLISAKSVYCFGQGNSASIAMAAWSRFVPITNKFHWIADSHLQADTAALFAKDEVILYFSFSGSTKELIETGRLVQASNGKLILITRFPFSPGSELSDVVIICGTNESPENQGSVAAKVGQMLIIDLLFNEYCSHEVELVIQNKKKTLDATEKKMQRRII